jgi:hypothetical protein
VIDPITSDDENRSPLARDGSALLSDGTHFEEALRQSGVHTPHNPPPGVIVRTVPKEKKPFRGSFF